MWRQLRRGLSMWLAAAQEPAAMAAYGRRAAPCLASPELTGAGLVAMLGSSVLAGNFDDALFRAAFAPAVLRTKSFSDVDQALLFHIDLALQLWAGSSCAARLPLDVRLQCQQSQERTYAAAMQVHTTLNTTLASLGVHFAFRHRIGPYMPLTCLPLSHVVIEVSGPWNCAPAPSASEFAITSPSSLNESARGYGPSLTSLLQELNLAAYGWSVHRVSAAQLAEARDIDRMRTRRPRRLRDDSGRGPSVVIAAVVAPTSLPLPPSEAAAPTASLSPEVVLSLEPSPVTSPSAAGSLAAFIQSQLMAAARARAASVRAISEAMAWRRAKAEAACVR